MCGIFGASDTGQVDTKVIDKLASYATQRGKDSSGLIVARKNYEILRADFKISSLLHKSNINKSQLVLGHSRLVTNGTDDNQPIFRDGVIAIHNGIIVNTEKLWKLIGKTPKLKVDSEIIPAFIETRMAAGIDLESAAQELLFEAEGVIACAAVVPSIGKLALFSNNGSLYMGKIANEVVFASERFPLTQVDATSIIQVREPIVVDVPISTEEPLVKEWTHRTTDLVPSLSLYSNEEKLLVYPEANFLRCTKCILPETMPYIKFDTEGVCNYCTNYKLRNHPRPKEELFELVEPYRRSFGDEVLVPFSGGRDSCYALHLIVNELGLKPITYTYDWGMVTDLGRRNISRMSANLGVENIIVAADITKKRDYIRRNLEAWIKSPHLGMLSVLTAGDKHFFRYIEDVKNQTGIGLNLWGINPLEVTHFKSGFLGVAPDFAEERVYSHGALKQLNYQKLRLKTMLESPGYFNRSLWDTLSGEYYRSFTSKSDYFHIFDYWRWDEKEIDETLLNRYDWERAPDTTTTWRIGDGTAAFYNYAYRTIAGFTEHDTFRSNQIREGDISREEALRLVEEENIPRYANLKWYLDVVGVDFEAAIKAVNETKRLYSE